MQYYEKFHWRGGYLTKEVLSELLELFDEEAKAKDKRAFVSVNWPQAVLRVRFADGIGEEQIEIRSVMIRRRQNAFSKSAVLSISSSI